MIYFLQPVDGGPIKIGCAVNVGRRHRALESFYGCKLNLLGTMFGGWDREAEIQAMFEHLRLGRTEQFRPAAELLEFIGCPELVPAWGGDEPLKRLARPMGHGRGRPPAERTRSASLNLRFLPETSAWVDYATNETGLSRTALVEAAFAALAREEGLEPPPPR